MTEAQPQRVEHGSSVKAPDDAQLLRSVGLRVTAQRLAVLDALGRGSHLSADQILTDVRQQLESVSVQGVYDVLHTLTDNGFLRRIEPAGSATRYERRVSDNHHHLVCRECGDVQDVACVFGSAPCLAPSDAAGFVVDEAEVTFWGTCADCASSPTTAVDEPTASKEM